MPPHAKATDGACLRGMPCINAPVRRHFVGAQGLDGRRGPLGLMDSCDDGTPQAVIRSRRFIGGKLHALRPQGLESCHREADRIPFLAALDSARRYFCASFPLSRIFIRLIV